MRNTTNSQAIEPQVVNLSPTTANALAAVLKSFAQAADSPELECDPRNVQEIDVQRVITLASLATSAPTESTFGNS